MHIIVGVITLVIIIAIAIAIAGAVVRHGTAAVMAYLMPLIKLNLLTFR